ncbi:MAG TPA: ABC transporter permease, partial [Limnochordia bacterium]
MPEWVRPLARSPRFLIGAGLLALVVGFALIGPLIWPSDPFRMVGGLFRPPSQDAWLGTDNFGRDVFTQLIHGTRTSLVIGFVAGCVATGIGVLIGTVGGYRGGAIDEALTGVTNVLITIPPIIVLILLSVALDTRSTLMMGVIIGVTSWPWTARAIRAQVSSLKAREHLDIARLSGAGTAAIIVWEILPYMLSYVVMAFILQMS